MINWLINATGLQDYATPIKIGVFALVSILLFGSGFVTGCNYSNNKVAAKTSGAIVEQVQDFEKLDLEVRKSQVEVKTVREKVYVEIPKIVTNDPSCDVGPDVIGLLNRNRALSTLPRNDETGAAASTNR